MNFTAQQAAGEKKKKGLQDQKSERKIKEKILQEKQTWKQEEQLGSVLVLSLSRSQTPHRLWR